MAEGWWTADTLGSLLAPGLAAVPGTPFPVHSAVRPWSGTYHDVEALARRLAAGLRLHRIIQAVELSVLILIAAIVDAAAGGLAATRVLTIGCLVIAALMVVAHLVAIVASRRLR
jgi:hypothetical protein